ncbi:MAG: DUF4129 domain-containing protein [Gemmatimonadaceae bacterium]
MLALMQVAQRAWPPSVVHDSVAAIARELVYRRNLRQSIGERLMMWLSDWIGQLIRFVQHSTMARPLGLAFIALIVVLIVARLLFAASARHDGTATGARRARKGAGEDPFVLADALEREGRFEDAAHALYRGVLLTLAHTDRLRLDPSKTSGDYARELRVRGSSADGPFRAFARRFDVAVYGHGRCDAELIVDLRRLASPFAPRARAA